MESMLSKGIDIKGLSTRLRNPIKFNLPQGGATAYGFEATILQDICAVVIEAARLGKLKKQQNKMSRACAVLQHAFATVGIIALVDEATGYQEFRSRDALAEILEKFVQKELRPWVKTFPPEYYEQIFRLNKWEYSPTGGSPGVLGHWTNNIIYRRLAPGVLDELRRLTDWVLLLLVSRYQPDPVVNAVRLFDRIALEQTSQGGSELLFADIES